MTIEFTGDDVSSARDVSGVTGDSIGQNTGTIKHGYNFGSVTKGLIAYYPFDGDATDATPLGNDGTDNTSAGFVTGQVGSQAKDFDGADDYVEASISYDFEKPWSIAFWGNHDSLADDQEMMFIEESGGSEYVGLSPRNNSVVYKVFSNGETSGHDVTLAHTTGVWYHFVLIWDGANFSVYFDGTQQIFDQPSSTGWLSTLDTLRVAELENFSSNDGAWNGQADDVRIYDRALSQPEIERLANLTETSTVTPEDTLQ